MRNVHRFCYKGELLSAFWNNFSQPATTWFVAIQVNSWTVKRATSLLNSFAVMLRKLHVFVACFTITLSMGVGERSTLPGFLAPCSRACYVGYSVTCTKSNDNDTNNLNFRHLIMGFCEWKCQDLQQERNLTSKRLKSMYIPFLHNHAVTT